MKYATFINFTAKTFTAYWDGRPYTFKPGQKADRMKSPIAAHFAKHLTNKVLTKSGKENYCSPKKPQDVPQFMEIFNKAYIIEKQGREFDSETGLPIDIKKEKLNPDEISMNINVEPTKKIGELEENDTIDPYDARANSDMNEDKRSEEDIIASDEVTDEDTFEGNVVEEKDVSEENVS